MASLSYCSWEGQRNAELRVVLLGGRNSGKSMVGNILLDREEFVTQEHSTCLRRHAEVQGRRVMVLNTPGWWCDFQVRETPELVKRELIRSVYLSFPGPHAFLLVIKAESPFNRKRRQAVAEHLDLLGESVWSHTIVVFTKGEHLKNVTLGEGQKGEKDLQWLLDKCGNKQHVLIIRNGNNITQVAELLKKINRLVTGSGNGHFEMDRDVLLEVVERTRVVDEKAQQRLTKTQKQRAVLKEKSSHLSSIRLVLLGARGSGKSSTGSTILAAGGEWISRVKERTACCVEGSCKVAGRQVTVVDTPGWWMNYSAQDTPAATKQEIVRGVFMCPPGPHGLLVVVRVDRAFTEMYRVAVQEHVELLGKSAWSHSMVLFTFGDWLGDTTIEQHIESEGKALQWIIERCGNRYHILNNKSKADGFQVTEFLEKVEEMVAANNGQLYITDVKVFDEMEKKQRAVEAEAKQRHLNMKMQREGVRAFMRQRPFCTEMRIVLLGGKHSGKTSAANTILSSEDCEVSVNVSEDLQAVRKGTVEGKKVILLDTSGWASQQPNPSDFRKQSLEPFLVVGHCALLLVVNASCSFQEINLRAAETHIASLGEDAWQRTLVLFTNGDWLGDTMIEQHIECEGDTLRTLVEKCGNRYHVLNNKHKQDGTQVAELLEKVEEICAEEWLMKRLKEVKIERTITRHDVKMEGAGQTEGAKGMLSSNSQTFNNEVNEPGSQGEHQTAGVNRCQDTPFCGSDDVRISDRDTYLVRETTGVGRALSVYTQLNGGQRQSGKNGGRLVAVFIPDLFCSRILENFMDSIKANICSSGPSSALLAVSGVQAKKRTQREEPQHSSISPSQCIDQQHSSQTPTDEMRERALKDFVQTGSLQDLIDQWGSSNVEELEGFIDSYFESIWNDAMESETPKQTSLVPSATSKCDVMAEADYHELLSSINRKLCKLDDLEGIQKNLQDLRQSTDRSFQIIQELSNATETPVNCIGTSGGNNQPQNPS